jgi:hypothetical protein
MAEDYRFVDIPVMAPLEYERPEELRVRCAREPAWCELYLECWHCCNSPAGCTDPFMHAMQGFFLARCDDHGIVTVHYPDGVTVDIWDRSVDATTWGPNARKVEVYGNTVAVGPNRTEEVLGV